MGPGKGLNDFMQILKSPDIYPDIAGAGFFMSPFIAVASSIIAYAGMVALLFILLRIAADVLVMSGAGNMISNETANEKIGKLSSKGIEKCVGDPWAYVKKHAVNIMLMLAFVGLMISGHILPLAGTVTASIGSIISKVSDINPVPYIDALDVSLEGINTSVKKSSINTMMKEYNKHAGNLVTAKQAADKSESLSESDYRQAAVAYFNSYYSAEIYRAHLEGELHNVKLDARETDTNRGLSRDEELLRNFNSRGHLDNADRILIRVALDGSNGAIYVADEQLKTRAESLIGDLETARSGGTKFEAGTR